MRDTTRFSEDLLGKVGPLMAAETDDEGGNPYLVVVVGALAMLHHAVGPGNSQLQARQMLSALAPVRRVVVDGKPNRGFPDAKAAIYACAVCIQLAGLAQGDLDAAIKELDNRLPENVRSDIRRWAHNTFLDVGNYGFDEQEGWFAVEMMIKGRTHLDACFAIADGNAARKKMEAYLAQSRPEPRIGRALPDGGSYLSTPEMTSVRFADGSGVTMIGGKLSVILPRK